MTLNEITLSNDLKTIEFEINQHRMFASNSIIEIGKRLNHVKENDLAHGQFMDWVENTLDMSYVTANRYMKVAKEFPNISPARTLSLDNLYEISTLPQDPKRQEVKKIEDGNPSSRKEIRDLKKQLKQKDELIENMADSMHDFELHAKELADENEQLKNKPAEVVEKEVVIEKVPDDYHQLKEQSVQFQSNYQLLKEQYNKLVDSRKEVDEKSRKYEELSRAIEEMQGRMSQGQKQIAAQKEVYELVRSVNKLITETAPLTYLVDTESVLSNEHAQKPIEKIINNLRDMADRLEKNITTKIIEGEIIND